MKNFSFLLLSLLISQIIFPQENLNQITTDTTKPVQYRRGVDIQPGYQSYEEKYFGKNLNEVKKSLFPLQSTGVWTELNPKVPRVDYLGIHFVNKDTGWICGDLGAIIKTTNGGSSWTVSETNTNSLLLKIHSYDGQIVIVTGYDGIILRSSDGGENFEQVLSGVGSSMDLWGVQMINHTLGWVCGLNQTLLKTIDGGLTWFPVSAGLNQHYWSLDFLNEQYGMIACGNGAVLKTTNGGSSWTQIQAGDTRALYTIDIIDSLQIAAAGVRELQIQYEGGKNVYSSDAGVTWIQNPDIPTYTDANWIEFVDTDTGYAMTVDHGIYKTTNRGQSWISVGGGGQWQLDITEDGMGYSGGDGLNIYKRTNGIENWSRIFLNDNFSDVFFVNEQKGFIISWSGLSTPSGLYKTTNGGINWEKVPGAPDGPELLFLDTLTGFIGSNLIYKTTNGGENWYATNGAGQATKIFFVNPLIGWAVGGRSIYKTMDGGENWITQFTHINDSFTSIFFVDNLNGWVTSRYVHQTTDGGVSWIERADIPAFLSKDILFNDYLNGFVIESNKFYSTIDGGVNWILNPLITGFSIAGKFSKYENSIFVTGFKTFRSIDGGVNWFDFDELTGIRINGLSLLAMGFGFAAGELGIVLKYYDETIPVELMNFTALIEYNKVSLNWITASETNNNGFFIERIKVDENYWKTLTFINGAGTSTNANLYSYRDRLNKFGKYKYRLKQIDYNGQYEYSNEIEVDYINKFDFYLSQNYPNPYNPATNIDFNIPEKTFVRIILYDVTGREIKKIIDQEMEAGNYSVSLSSEGLSSGVYFYKMITGSGYTAVNKLTIIK